MAFLPFILKALPSIVALVAAVSPVVSPLIVDYVAQHPQAATVIAALAAIFANFSPQPHRQ